MSGMVLAQVARSSTTYQISYLFYSLALSGLIGGIIGYFKNRIILGFILGALLGCIGWIIMGFIDKKRLY